MAMLQFRTFVMLIAFLLHMASDVSCDGETTEEVDDSEEEEDGKIETEADENFDQFEPTDQWKPIMKGQKIPAGLHVRLNLQTGEREAKLLLDETDSSQDRHLRSVEGVSESQHKQLTHLGDKLAASATGQTKDESYREFIEKEFKQQYEKSVRKKHRTKEELKAILERGGIGVKSEMELLQEACDSYRANDLTEQQRLRLLKDIEFYVHQIDSAKNFAKSGDLDMVIKSLNDSSESVRSAAALVVGSAVQSNGHVQVKAVEAAALSHLVRMLATESQVQPCLHALYATSALLRHFPLAQLRFLQLGGLHALPRLFTLTRADRLKVKVVSFVDDLLTEHLNAQMEANPSYEAREKFRQYQLINLVDSLSQLDWCKHIPPLLSLAEHDSREKIATAMWSLRSFCLAAFQGSLPMLANLRDEYRGLASAELLEDGTPGYFHDVHAQFEKLISALSNDHVEL